jgi:hypothetical protein
MKHKQWFMKKKWMGVVLMERKIVSIAILNTWISKMMDKP